MKQNRNRHRKVALTGFTMSVDCLSDVRVQRLMDKRGAAAAAIYVALLCDVFEHGYYLHWTDEARYLLARAMRCDEVTVDEVVNDCVELNLLSRDALEREGVLTSYEIQQCYVQQMRVLRRAGRLGELVVDDQNMLVQPVVEELVKPTELHTPAAQEQHIAEPQVMPQASSEQAVVVASQPQPAVAQNPAQVAQNPAVVAQNNAPENVVSRVNLQHVAENLPKPSEDSPQSSEEKQKERQQEKKEEESFPHTPFKEVERKEKEKEKEKFVDDVVVVKTTMSPKNFGISSIRKGLGVSTIQPMSQDELKAARLRTHVSELRGDEVWREVMCMRFEITAADLDRYIDTFELECRCNGSLHNDANDCKRHCVNWLHKRREIEQKEKLNQQKFNQQTHTNYASNFQRNNPRRRGFDPSLLTPADYEGKF